jgi:uncharacterized protein
MDIKLDKTGRGRSRRTGGTARSGTGRAVVKAKAESSFEQKLLETRRSGLREELAALFISIDAQAMELEKSLTFESLRVYKEMIQKFVGIAVNELYAVEERLSVSPTGKRKSLLLVKRLDAELEALTDQFLTRQQNLIGFLARIDQIRGLLLDLYS